MPWVRQGECTRCGACCIDYNPTCGPTASNTPEAVEMAETVGTAGKVANACPLFEWVEKDGKTIGFCSGHEPPVQSSFYLKTCQLWPRQPEDIVSMPDCGFSFVWTDE